jgi:hypothetical protein
VEPQQAARGSVVDLRRRLAERGFLYQALLFGTLLFAVVLGSFWFAGMASASSYSLPAALVTVVVLVVLVGWLIVSRRDR